MSRRRGGDANFAALTYPSRASVGGSGGATGSTGATGATGAAGKVDASGRAQYPSGAAAGAAAFLVTGGVQINLGTKGCIAQPAAGTIGACNTAAATGANLDTANGATTGCLVALGGGAFCNYGP